MRNVRIGNRKEQIHNEIIQYIQEKRLRVSRCFQIPGGGVGDIEILSSTKLDSREKFKETRNIIAGNFDDCEESNVTILNVILLRRMYK